MRLLVVSIFKLAAIGILLFVGLMIYSAFVDMGLSHWTAFLSVIGLIGLALYMERDNDEIARILRYPFK